MGGKRGDYPGGLGSFLCHRLYRGPKRRRSAVTNEEGNTTMTDTRKHRFAVDLLLRIALFFLAILWTAALSAAQQNPAALQITSPTNGTIVNPGQTISVGVTSPANIAFTALGVVAEDPIELSNIGTSVPFQFSFTIPANIACRSYALTANATTRTPQNPQSNPHPLTLTNPDITPSPS